jgi:hypothetical protein
MFFEFECRQTFLGNFCFSLTQINLNMRILDVYDVCFGLCNGLVTTCVVFTR